jgi:hypothetical protein
LPATYYILEEIHDLLLQRPTSNPSDQITIYTEGAIGCTEGRVLARGHIEVVRRLEKGRELPSVTSADDEAKVHTPRPKPTRCRYSQFELSHIPRQE